MSIGQSIKRIDAYGKVTGETEYPGDINMPNQAYAKILFANRPHAIIKSIDTTKAEALEGVIGIYTAKDVPVNEYGLGIKDQPVLCGPGAEKPYTDRVRFIGDQVAFIVAESETIAAQARDLIEVEYEVLQPIIDSRKAMETGAPIIHDEQEYVDFDNSDASKTLQLKSELILGMSIRDFLRLIKFLKRNTAYRKFNKPILNRMSWSHIGMKMIGL